ncbi:doublesex- and mab-3-related transcription factor C1-like isoform X2 [Arvicanthis niloticus]|uniref:doublesex- and mab-3-related transcription factor C1-like isoform X2 n=1 Tax=Arvicanthis niloticus TaxID=61156 RepID=UPI001486A6A8|nr:doublesex- and mab-3-related transcription factor C1-like [Arvicanthis niloticus]
MSAEQCAPRSVVMDEQLYLLYQPEVLLHTGPQQENQVPLMLRWPTVFINITCTPVTLNPQMTLSFTWDLSQPMTIPYSFSNVIMQPSASTAPPVQPAQVSNISSQNPGTANQAPVICTQSNNVSNQVPEVDTQDPVASNQGSFSAEEDRQKVMDAAEALLILHNSPQACQETGSTPGTDGSED